MTSTNIELSSDDHITSNTTTNSGEIPSYTQQELAHIQKCIEKCFALYLNRTEIILTLQNQLSVHHQVSEEFLNSLEEKNPNFFKIYYQRLKIKAQIQEFNQLSSLIVQNKLTKKPITSADLSAIQTSSSSDTTNNIMTTQPSNTTTTNTTTTTTTVNSVSNTFLPLSSINHHSNLGLQTNNNNNDKDHHIQNNNNNNNNSLLNNSQQVNLNLNTSTPNTNNIPQNLYKSTDFLSFYDHSNNITDPLNMSINIPNLSTTDFNYSFLKNTDTQIKESSSNLPKQPLNQSCDFDSFLN